jgi:hypothetical protein
MAEEAVRLLQGWEKATASGCPVDLHRQMTAYTMRVLGRLLLGSDLDGGIAEVAGLPGHQPPRPPPRPGPAASAP